MAKNFGVKFILAVEPDAGRPPHKNEMILSRAEHFYDYLPHPFILSVLPINLHIFEPKFGDFIQEGGGNSFYYVDEHLRLVDDGANYAGWHNEMKIIQRNDKAFIMPQEEE